MAADAHFPRSWVSHANGPSVTDSLHTPKAGDSGNRTRAYVGTNQVGCVVLSHI